MSIPTWNSPDLGGVERLFLGGLEGESFPTLKRSHVEAPTFDIFSIRNKICMSRVLPLVSPELWSCPTYLPRYTSLYSSASSFPNILMPTLGTHSLVNKKVCLYRALFPGLASSPVFGLARPNLNFQASSLTFKCLPRKNIFHRSTEKYD